MRKAAARTGLITLMLAGGLLSAGISQAQDIGATDAAQERAAEAVAAGGGPAASDRLIPFAADQAAVEVRTDDVADVPSTVSRSPSPETAGAAAGRSADPSQAAAASVGVQQTRQLASAEQAAHSR